MYLTHGGMLYSFALAFSFCKYGGDCSIVVHRKLPPLSKIAASRSSFRGPINKTPFCLKKLEPLGKIGAVQEIEVLAL